MVRPLIPSLLSFGVTVTCAAACGGDGSRPASPPIVQVEVSPAVAPTSASIIRSAETKPPPPPAAFSLEPLEVAPDPAYCGGPCSGLPNDTLVEAIGKRAKRAHRCYDAELASTPGLGGRVVVKMRVGSDGRICAAKPASEPKMNAVAACVAGYFRGAVGKESLPAPTGGCADLDLPLVFVQKGDAGAP